MLLQIRDFIRRQQVVSNQQIARQFCLDMSALQPMLDVWLRKGIIDFYQQGAKQKLTCQDSCFKCQLQLPVYYQYMEDH